MEGEPSREDLIKVLESQNQRLLELEERLKIASEYQRKESPSVTFTDTKIEGVTMPKFHGKPHESVDQYFFSAKMFLTCKNIDYYNNEEMNQRRIVAILASNLRDGAASWFHSTSVNGQYMRTIEELYEEMKKEFVPRDEEHRAREDLSNVKQRSSLEEYVNQFRRAMSKINNMHELDKVHHFTQGLKDQTKREVRYLRCQKLSDAIAAAQAYDRAHFTSRNHSTRLKFTSNETFGQGINQYKNERRSDMMDISFTSRINKEECMKKNLCFYCKKPGHSIGDCRKRKANSGQQQQPMKYNNNVQVNSVDCSNNNLKNQNNINQFDLSQYTRKSFPSEQSIEFMSSQ